jgi:hypothetical protein
MSANKIGLDWIIRLINEVIEMKLSLNKNRLLAMGLLLTSMGLNRLALAGPAEEGQQLSAQINVTRDVIQQFMAKMKVAPSNSTYQNPDYLARSKAFNVRVEKAMEVFESRMTGTILKKAEFWLQRLRDLEKAPGYSTEQRQALLADQHKNATTVFLDLSKEYHEAIHDLYRVVFPRAYVKTISSNYHDGLLNDVSQATYEISFPNGEFSPIKAQLIDHQKHGNFIVLGNGIKIPLSGEYFDHDNGNSAIFRDSFGIRSQSSSLWNAIKNKILDTILLDFPSGGIPEIREYVYRTQVSEDCFSNSCVALVSSQLTSYLTLLKQSLDIPIVLKSANGLVLQLTPLNVEINRVLEYVALRPGEHGHLPFDISETDFRKQALERIQSSLFDSPKNFEKGACPKNIARLKEILCHSEGSCMSEGESNLIRDAISRAKLKKIPERLACLR